MKNLILIIGVALASIDIVYSCSCVEVGPGNEVCASDGKTYNDTCLVNCVQFYRNETEPCLTTVSKGICGPSPCICKDACAHICASNGQTYGNECTFECAKKVEPNLTKVKDGFCGGE